MIKKTAYECYEKAAHNGNAYGMFQKGSMLIDDRNTFYNLGEGVKGTRKVYSTRKRTEISGGHQTTGICSSTYKIGWTIS